ncbi:hypothetical protein C1H76_5693 [Elsinoe australis]|uniref:Uncharacterized protein n=1 Tax=Elsinoe australis TaxID=40998 RepID=A0A4U7AZF5_9PEZI|nr:hypothetical protein C1H76_5693 [Elsinoe australis]
MASHPPTQPPPQTLSTQPPSAPPQQDYARAIHNLALGLALVCPAIIAIPPRRLDIMTAILGGTTVVSLNHLHRDAYGYGALGRFGLTPRGGQTHGYGAEQGQGTRLGQNGALPTEKARQLQAQFREAREAGMSEGERERRRKEEREGWKEKRDREIREKFEEGKGVGDVIWEQVWEVWNWGKTEGEEDGEGKKNG